MNMPQLSKHRLSTVIKFVAALGLLACLSSNLRAAISTFQQDLNGYVATHDAEIAQDPANAGNNLGANATLSADQDDPSGSQNDTQVLIRFDNIIGSDPGQVPPGINVNLALLRVYTVDPGSDGPTLYRMLTSWDESTATWNFFTDGVQADDIEASLTADGIIPNAGADETFTEIDVTATVQAWVNGTPNNGWVIFPAGGNGWDTASSENAITNRRPQLTVDYGTILPPSFTAHPSNTTVLECRTASMSVVVEGSQPISLQWWVESPPGSAIFVQIDSTVNPTATNATLVISNAQISDASTYFAQANNAGGMADSSQAVLTVNPDNEGPVLVSAVVNGARTEVTLSFSEPIQPATPQPCDPCFDNAQDSYKYQIIHTASNEPLAHQNSPLPLIANRTNLVLIIDTTLNNWLEGQSYHVTAAEVPDDCAHVPGPFGDSAPISAPVSFREGLRGYVGTLDTEINQGAPDTDLGQAASLTVDAQDEVVGGVNMAAHGLIRFDNVFGNNLGQVPIGSIINRATLSIYQNNPGTEIIAHRMLADWTESSTWNSLVAGVTNDGVEAVVAAEFSVAAQSPDDRYHDFEVTAAVQAWSDNPGASRGWAFLPTGNDGWDINSSENATETTRPTLTIDYTEVIGPVGFVQQPPSSINITEKQTLNISVVTTGSSPNFTWEKEIGGTFTDTGVTTPNYVKASAVAGDSGNYRVIVCNSINCVTSDDCQVTVTPDTTAPTVTLTSIGINRTTLNLAFSEEVTALTGGNAGNYSITPDVGIMSVTLSPNGRTAVVETGERAFRTTYTLTLTGIQDTSEAGNTTTTNIAFMQDSMLIAGSDWFDEWRHELFDQVGVAWTNADFNDDSWFPSPGIFGLEPSGAGSNTLRNAGLTLAANNYQPTTPWPVSSNQPTVYVRKHVMVPSDLSLVDLEFQLHHYVDDGCVVYVNGPEAFRIGFGPTVNVTFTNYSAGAPGPGTEVILMTNAVPLVIGDNVLAVEVHQQGATSSDIVWAARVVAVHKVQPPLMTITQDGSGNVTVSWTPAVGQLEESADLVNWSSSSRANGIPAPPSGGNLFYRVSR